MKYVFTNGKNLNGTKDMQVQEGQVILVENERITEILPAEEAGKRNLKASGYEEIDLQGKYILPGLINMHVHLAGNGKPQKKQRDNEALVKKIMSNGLTKAIAYHMVCGFAKDELYSGVTTIRTVGGLGDFDTRLRDDIAAGKKPGPRILAANEGISVPGGHMAGSVAIAAGSIEEALQHLEIAKAQKVDLVKLMITGGVLDAKEKGVPGELKMAPEMVKAVCDKAHAMGYKVAAHVESPKGVKVALQNGVDSIEHGAKADEEMIALLRNTMHFCVLHCLRRFLMHCSIVPLLMLPKWNSLTAMWYLKVSLTVRRRRSPTIFLWYWAMMWDAPGSPSMISGENCTTSTSMWESPILLHCTPLPAGAPKWQASEISPVHWNPVNARI